MSRHARDPTCGELVELVTDYFENAISPRDRTRLEAHVAGCTECIARARETRWTIDLLAATRRSGQRPDESALLELFRDWQRSRRATSGRAVVTHAGETRRMAQIRLERELFHADPHLRSRDRRRRRRPQVSSMLDAVAIAPGGRLSVVAAMQSTRARTIELVDHLEPARLEVVIDPIMSPLAWDLGHIAAYEDLWINHRLAGRPHVRQDLGELYDAFETPRAVRGELDFLRGAALWSYLAEVRERALAAPVGDGLLHELVIRHELQHSETMLQAMAVGGMLPPSFPGPQPAGGTGLEVLEVPGGPAPIGSPPHGFADDNERPRHVVDVPEFAIARAPATNAAWLDFVEAGGYERREWWSDAGWAWRTEHGIHDHAGARRDHPDAPVVHVCWFEADAFARAHDGRLPNEVEWETAAGAGLLQGVGEVWEWTASPFRGYPGFVAHPYREYSEVFFGERYRVLRGWSCATHERVRSHHFRNRDLPQRRQLFAGVRIAR